jgi:surface protein
MTRLIGMLCMMCTLNGLVHLITRYSMILIYLVLSLNTQTRMFQYAHAFNQDISKWDTSSATDFVSEYHEWLTCFVWCVHWMDWHIWLLAISWYSSILLLHTLHSTQCLLMQVPLIKILVSGILRVPPILWVNVMNDWHALYDVYIEWIGTFDLMLFHDTYLLCCFIHHIVFNVFWCKCL